MHSESFTCPNPDCGKTSYHPEDIREGVLRQLLLVDRPPQYRSDRS